MKLIWLQLNDLTVFCKDGDVVGRFRPKDGSPLAWRDDTTEVEYMDGKYAMYRAGPWGACTAKVMLAACQDNCESPLRIYRQAVVDNNGYFVGKQAGWKNHTGLKVATITGSDWANAPAYTGPTPAAITVPEPAGEAVGLTAATLQQFHWNATAAPTPAAAEDEDEDDEPELIWTKLSTATDPNGPIKKGDIVGPAVCHLNHSYDECVTACDGPLYSQGQGMFVMPMYWMAGDTWQNVLKTCQEVTSKKLYYYRLNKGPQKLKLNAFHSQQAPLP